MDGEGGEALLVEDCLESLAALDVLDEDDDLVEVELVQDIGELASLLLLEQVNVVLLQAVQCKLRVVVNKHLHGLRNSQHMVNLSDHDRANVVHEFLGEGSSFGR